MTFNTPPTGGEKGNAMTTELAKPDNGIALIDDSKVELLKRTICKGATNDELELFIHACKRTGLDPFMKQIHAVKRKQRQDDGQYREVMTIQTGIDGYRLIAERSERYMPGREPTFEYDRDGNVAKATAYVMKLDKAGTWHEIGASAHFSEYASFTRDGSPTAMWRDKPHIMLAKCAEALALRRAFPAEMSGIYTREEMEQADNHDAPTEPRVVRHESKPKKEDAPVVPGADMTVEEALQYGERIDQAFKSRGFDVPDAEAAIAKVLGKFKLPNHKAGGKAWCEKFIANIEAGMYDKMKPVAAESVA